MQQAAASAPHERPWVVSHGRIPVAAAVLGQQPAASAVSLRKFIRAGPRATLGRNNRSSSRAAAAGAIRRAAACAKVPPVTFTPRMDELCSRTCPASPSGWCARWISRSSASTSSRSTNENSIASLPPSVQQAAAPAPHERPWVVCHGRIPVAAAVLGQQPAASAVSLRKFIRAGPCATLGRNK